MPGGGRMPGGGPRGGIPRPIGIPRPYACGCAETTTDALVLCYILHAVPSAEIISRYL